MPPATFRSNQRRDGLTNIETKLVASPHRSAEDRRVKVTGGRGHTIYGYRRRGTLTSSFAQNTVLVANQLILSPFVLELN
jgi:hypothetical protein